MINHAAFRNNFINIFVSILWRNTIFHLKDTHRSSNRYHAKKKTTGRVVPPLPSMLQDQLGVYEAKMLLGRHENTNWQPWNQPSTAQGAQGKQVLRLQYSYIGKWLMRKAPPLLPGNGSLTIKPCQDFVT